MLKPLFLASFILLASIAHAGTFAVSEVLYMGDAQQVDDYLQSRGYKAFVLSSPEHPEITVIAEEKSGTQDERAIEALLADTSKKFGTMAVAYLNHDSDVVYCVGYYAGKKIFFYNSRPGYFEGDETPPSCEGLDELAGRIGIDKQALAGFLVKEKVDSYTFADDLLADMLKSENLPPWIAGIDFSYLQGDPEILGWCEENGITVRKPR